MDYHKELGKDVYSEKTQHLKLKLIKAKDIPEGKHKAVIFDSKKPIATKVIIKPVKTTPISEREYLKLGADKIFKKGMSNEEFENATSKINAKYKKYKCPRKGRPKTR